MRDGQLFFVLQPVFRSDRRRGWRNAQRFEHRLLFGNRSCHRTGFLPPDLDLADFDSLQGTNRFRHRRDVRHLPSHPAFNLQGEHADKDGRPDPVLGPVKDRPQQQRALQTPPTALDLGQLLVTMNYFLGGKQRVRRLHHKHPVDLRFPQKRRPVFRDMDAAINQSNVVKAKQVPVAKVIANPVVRPLRSLLTPPRSRKGEFLKLVLDPCVGLFQPFLPRGEGRTIP